MSYPYKLIEEKWQKLWKEKSVFRADFDPKKKKFYALDMFPYPSGKGLHIGHLASYTPTDVIARFKRMQSYNVLHPMGWDAFGLPAEQYAIQTGVHPEVTTQKAISNFKNTLVQFGFSFDWEREVSTCDHGFYKWTQFLFLKLFEKGLVYQTEAPVNWCPELKTVLANEEVIDGKSERGSHPVVRLKMKQWMIKITDYAQRLLDDLEDLDWPESTKEVQRNWIGKSEGCLIRFLSKKDHIDVFSTRPETLFGASFLNLAPEHPLVQKWIKEGNEELKNYVLKAKEKSDLDRKASLDKTGVFTHHYATCPVTQRKLAIWVSNYVLMDYGSGAIMCVPAHDERDFEFAKKMKLPTYPVIQSEKLPFTGNGKMINSDFLNGLDSKKAKSKMIDYLEKNKMGKRKIQYKIRDWLFSRQRYWGEPFPLIYDTNNKVKALKLKDLAVKLPEVTHYEPSDTAKSPLSRNKDFMSYEDENGEKYLREADTMPGSAASSWYFLRYLDPKNSKEAFSFEKQKYWMPVDLYIGGKEHSVGHLLYARFWHKVLYDLGLVSHKEPFLKLRHQGSVMGSDGQRMSKSRGNVVNPDELKEKYGADVLRLYICFLGPFEKDKPWSYEGIEGMKRFTDRLYKLNELKKDQKLSKNLEKLLHQTIYQVEKDYERMQFNTAISSLMILTNEVYKEKCFNPLIIEVIAKLIQPLAPHLSEQIWEDLGKKPFISLKAWPTYKKEYLKDDLCEIGVQINGRVRASIELRPDETEKLALEKACSLDKLQKYLKDQKIKKVIYKPAKILNIII